MEILQLSYRNSTVSYARFGSGPKLVLCFHGYGVSAISFEFLEKYAGDQYTFYAPDLPFHGRTEWKEGFDFSPEDLEEIVWKMVGEGTRNKTQGPRISLLGFSLGGRMALSLYQEDPEQFDTIVLLAPDGLKVNFWYWLATQSWAGNRFFSFTMKHPGWFFGFLKLLNKLKLVNVSIFKFVNYYIGDKEVRRLLYARWTTLRKLRPDRERIRMAVLNNKTKIKLVYGLHDRIILSSVGEKFRKGMESNCTLTIIDSGHQVLHEKHVKEIVTALSLP